MTVKFDRPPLVECLCGFIFAPSGAADATVPGLFYQQAKGILPNKWDQTEGDDEADGAQNKTSQISFASNDEKVFAQVSPTELVLNILAPYPGWEAFRDTILECLQYHANVSQPEGIRAVGLRYLNKIVWPMPSRDISSFDVSKYINAFPRVPDPLVDQGLIRFSQRVDVDTEFGMLSMSVRTEATELGTALAAHLDLGMSINVIDETKPPLSLEGVPDWLEKAHTKIKEAFLLLITEEAQKDFGRRDNV